jgi:branched-chain amino acid transport system ATP-binding protein
MLEVEDLRAGYGGVPVLMGATLAVAAGELVGVLGHNGMGKTTLLRAIMGVLRPTGGVVRLGGADLTGAPPHARARAGLAYVPQGREIFPGLSVLDNLRLAAVAAGRRPREAVPAVLAEFPRLEPLLGRPGGALSGGEQQLLALARALCQSPRVLLLDEPTEGIQPSIIEEMAERLRALRAGRGLGIVLVEQNLDFIKALADRVLVIQKGRIVRELAPDRLDAPELVDEFIGANPQGTT